MLINMRRNYKILKKELYICLKTRENESFLLKHTVAR
jgi:hypothetical protein